MIDRQDSTTLALYARIASDPCPQSVCEEVDVVGACQMLIKRLWTTMPTHMDKLLALNTKDPHT